MVVTLIDGGHLRALARNQGFDYTPDFIEECSGRFLSEDEEQLRILYYDCRPFNGTKTLPVSGEEQVFEQSGEWLDDLASRNLFAVRLGVLKFRGWRLKNYRAPENGAQLTDNHFKPNMEQKGVDLRIGLDIAIYAETGEVDRIAVVTGDTDLIPAMKLARRAGIQIVGIEFPGASLSRELAAHMDIRREVAWPDDK